MVEQQEQRIPEQAGPPERVTEIYVVPPGPPGVDVDVSFYLKLFPVPWWRRWWRWHWHWRWYGRHACCCCCCCCCEHAGRVEPAPAPAPQPAAPTPAPAPAPTIDLRQGTLPIGGAFYLLITPFGSRCQFVLEWTAAGGTGQLTVDLDVTDPSGATRRLASGRGPSDQYTFTGDRGVTYVFTATVTDSAGQSSFDTHTVVTP